MICSHDVETCLRVLDHLELKAGMLRKFRAARLLIDYEIKVQEVTKLENDDCFDCQEDFSKQRDQPVDQMSITAKSELEQITDELVSSSQSPQSQQTFFHAVTDTALKGLLTTVHNMYPQLKLDLINVQTYHQLVIYIAEFFSETTETQRIAVRVINQLNSIYFQNIENEQLLRLVIKDFEISDKYFEDVRKKIVSMDDSDIAQSLTQHFNDRQSLSSYSCGSFKDDQYSNFVVDAGYIKSTLHTIEEKEKRIHKFYLKQQNEQLNNNVRKYNDYEKYEERSSMHYFRRNPNYFHRIEIFKYTKLKSQDTASYNKAVKVRRNYLKKIFYEDFLNIKNKYKSLFKNFYYKFLDDQTQSNYHYGFAFRFLFKHYEPDELGFNLKKDFVKELLLWMVRYYKYSYSYNEKNLSRFNHADHVNISK